MQQKQHEQSFPFPLCRWVSLFNGRLCRDCVRARHRERL